MTRFNFVVRVVLWTFLASLPLFGCGGDEPSGLDVVVRTDLVAGYEFRRVVVEAESTAGPSDPETTAASRTEPWRAGVEVATLRRLSGEATIRVTLQDGSRDAVVSREVRVVDASRGRVVVVISRSCVGVSCGDGESCHGGVCANSACHPDAPESCPAPACTDGDASGCAPAAFACATSECAAGVCFSSALTREECSSPGTCWATDEWCDPLSGCSVDPDAPEAGVGDAGSDMNVVADGGTDMAIDGAACADDAPCTPSGFEWQCYAEGRIDCSRGGACVGIRSSTLDVGASCGSSFSGRVCNADYECVDCFDAGEACVRNDGTCRLGKITRESGCECVPDDDGEFLDPGSRCGRTASGVGMYCTTDTRCVPCMTEGLSCSRPEGPCLRGRQSCEFADFAGTATCAEAGMRSSGSICSIGSSDGLCDGASATCNVCQDGLACLDSSTGDAACVYGAAVCNTGSGGGIECDVTGSTNYVAAGTTCEENKVCTGSGSCLACTQGALCAPERECSVSRVDCSGGAVECVRESLLASGTTGRDDASAGETCSSTATCNGVDDECQPVMSNVLSVGVGPTHSCAVVANEAAPITRTNLAGVSSSIYCWGSNTLSALGINSFAQCDAGRAAIVDLCNDDPAIPDTLCRSSAAVSNPREVVVGHSTSCFLSESGSVYCWGNNLNAEVGGFPGSPDGDGLAYPTCSGVRDATPRQDLQCAVRSPRKVPLPLASGDKVVQLAISPEAPVNCTPTGYANSTSCTPPTGPQYRKVCAVTEQGKLYCWGGVGASGSSAVTVTTMMPTEAQEPDLYRMNAAWRFEQVAVGESHWCVLLRDTSTMSMTRGQSRVVCAGAHDRGQRGDGLARTGPSESTAFPPLPGSLRSVVGLPDAVDIAAAGRFACAVRANTTEGRGRVVCWGDFAGLSVDSGERADGIVRTPVYVRARAGDLYAIDAPSLPTDAAALVTGATSVDASERAVCVQLSSGGVACWGTSNLGIGTTNTSLHAVLLPSDPATDVFPSRPRTTVALAFQSGENDGTVGCFIRHHDRRQLFCWGSNGTRQLGHCRSTPGETRLAPVPVLPFDSALDGICRAVESLAPCVHIDP
jgi:hypothetical protein